jgi:hypothetical protein
MDSHACQAALLQPVVLNPHLPAPSTFPWPWSNFTSCGRSIQVFSRTVSYPPYTFAITRTCRTKSRQTSSQARDSLAEGLVYCLPGCKETAHSLCHDCTRAAHAPSTQVRVHPSFVSAVLKQSQAALPHGFFYSPKLLPPPLVLL